MLRYAAGLILMVVLVIAPASADAVRVGTKLPGAYDSSLGCGEASGCIHLQARLAGDPVRAPLAGTATKLNIQAPSGSLGLVVLRKRPSGEFKHVRSTALAPMSGIPTDVVTRTVDLRVRRGDYLGVRVSMGSSFGTQFSGLGNCKFGLVPPPAVGASSVPNPSYTGCARTLFYNVRITP